MIQNSTPLTWNQLNTFESRMHKNLFNRMQSMSLNLNFVRDHNHNPDRNSKIIEEAWKVLKINQINCLTKMVHFQSIRHSNLKIGTSNRRYNLQGFLLLTTISTSNKQKNRTNQYLIKINKSTKINTSQMIDNQIEHIIHNRMKDNPLI